MSWGVSAARRVAVFLAASFLLQAGFVQPDIARAQQPPTPLPASTSAPDLPSPEPSVAPAATPPALPSPTAEPTVPPPTPPADPPGVERVDLRTAASRTFEQADGTFISQFFSDAIFYQPDGSADWQPIDLTFAPGARDGALLAVENAPVKTLLAAASDPAGLLRVEGAGRLISLGLPADAAASSTATPAADPSGLFADYADLLPGGIGLRVFPRDDGLRLSS
jgi:hypothetical protein